MRCHAHTVIEQSKGCRGCAPTRWICCYAAHNLLPHRPAYLRSLDQTTAASQHVIGNVLDCLCPLKRVSNENALTEHDYPRPGWTWFPCQLNFPCCPYTTKCYYPPRLCACKSLYGPPGGKWPLPARDVPHAAPLLSLRAHFPCSIALLESLVKSTSKDLLLAVVPSLTSAQVGSSRNAAAISLSATAAGGSHGTVGGC